MSDLLIKNKEDYKILKRQQAKLRAEFADTLLENSEQIESEPARRIDEEAHAMALPATEEPTPRGEN